MYWHSSTVSGLIRKRARWSYRIFESEIGRASGCNEIEDETRPKRARPRTLGAQGARQGTEVYLPRGLSLVASRRTSSGDLSSGFRGHSTCLAVSGRLDGSH